MRGPAGKRREDFRVLHPRCSRWAESGVWAQVFAALAAEADNDYAMSDSTIVRAHQHSVGHTKKGAQAIGRSTGGVTTTCHVYNCPLSSGSL
jgi:hypothetical protein